MWEVLGILGIGLLIIIGIIIWAFLHTDWSK